MIRRILGACIFLFTSVRASLVKCLNDRYLNVETDEILSISTLLDPRFKLAGFSKENSSNLTLNRLKEILEEQDRLEHESIEPNIVESKPSKKLKLQFCDILSDDIKNRLIESPKPLDSIQSELDSYLILPNASIEEDVIKWWVDHKENFKRLYKIAIKFLIIPATSAASERIFSTAGLILNKKRSKLSPQHASLLIFLNKHLR